MIPIIADQWCSFGNGLLFIVKKIVEGWSIYYSIENQLDTKTMWTSKVGRLPVY
jgi:hypothetical protein